MTPEERRELLGEKTAGAEVLTFPKKEAPDPEVDKERRERQRLEDIAAVEAFRKKPQSVGEILRANIDMCRKALDPRVLLEAVEIGLSDAELDQKRERMHRWTDAVMLEPDGETYDQRKLRLQTLHDELYKEKPRPGCGCDGNGWLYTTGTMHIADDQIERDAEFYRLCVCDRGLSKLDEVRAMGKPKNAARGQVKKADRSDPTPF